MKYHAILYQNGGCDYTIGCGLKVVHLAASTWDEAVEETKKMILKNYDNDERRLDTICLIESIRTASLPVYDWYSEKRDKERKQQKRAKEEHDRREFERLKKKFEG